MSMGKHVDWLCTLDVVQGNTLPCENGWTWLRHREDSQAGCIDLLVLEGEFTTDEMVREIDRRGLWREDQSHKSRTLRVEDHIRHLQAGNPGGDPKRYPHFLYVRSDDDRWKFDLSVENSGIVDGERNPFAQSEWIGQGYPCTEGRQKQLEQVFDKSIDEIKSLGRNEAEYPAFVGIRWGFAAIDGGRLVRTSKWDNKCLYDDTGRPNSPEDIDDPAVEQARKGQGPRVPKEKKIRLSERDMETLIAADPEKYIGESGLRLVKRQLRIENYRFDLLFEDRHGGKLIVEIQKGTLDRNHTYKILDYYDAYKGKRPDEFIELMVIANKIPYERRTRLSAHGIEYREIPMAEFGNDSQIRVVLGDGEKKDMRETRKPTSKAKSPAKPQFKYRNQAGFLVDESKYTVESRLERCGETAASLFEEFHKGMAAFSRKLSVSGKAGIWARTHVEGLTYLIQDGPAFIYLNFRRDWLVFYLFTNYEAIEGLESYNWQERGKGSGAKLRIDDPRNVGLALEAARKAYFLIVERK